MGRKIVSTGRGGAGKTIFAALATRYLSGSLLLLDIDPDQSLADMLGIDLEKEGVRTVLDILFDIQKKRGYEELGTMHLHLMANFRFTKDAEKFIQDAGATYLVKIEPDDKVEECK